MDDEDFRIRIAIELKVDVPMELDDIGVLASELRARLWQAAGSCDDVTVMGSSVDYWERGGA